MSWMTTPSVVRSFCLGCVLNSLLAQSPNRMEDSRLLREASSEIIYERILYDRPRFYKGPMPLKYIAAQIIVRTPLTGQLDKWYEFADFRLIADHSDVRWPADSVNALDQTGRVVAELKLIPKESTVQRYKFEELHYDKQGVIVFRCVSAFSRNPMRGDWGFKIQEKNLWGIKQNEYFFMIP